MAHLAPASPRGRRQRQTAIRRNRTTLPSISTDHVLATLARATPDDERTGLAWYSDAHAIATTLATGSSLTTRQTAGILAALSPQTGWYENIGRATDYVATGATDHFPDAIAKCDRIAAGADPTDVLGGRKVRSFFANIADPTRSGAVTVDRHALTIALGVHPTDAERHRIRTAAHRALERPGIYAAVAGCYRAAARLTDLRPHEVQAITWTTWRRETGADRFDTGEPI